MKQLRKIAKEQGVELVETEGGKHSKGWIGAKSLIVPRHREINELTARGILRKAESEES